jgi:hypothetical protein
VNPSTYIHALWRISGRVDCCFTESAQLPRALASGDPGQKSTESSDSMSRLNRQSQKFQMRLVSRSCCCLSAAKPVQAWAVLHGLVPVHLDWVPHFALLLSNRRNSLSLTRFFSNSVTSHSLYLCQDQFAYLPPLLTTASYEKFLKAFSFNCLKKRPAPRWLNLQEAVLFLPEPRPHHHEAQSASKLIR